MKKFCCPIFYSVYALLLVAACEPSKVNWKSVEAMSLTSETQAVHIQKSLSVKISGGVAPFTFSWPVGNSWAVEDHSIVLNSDRPWTPISGDLLITDSLGTQQSISIETMPGVVQINSTAALNLVGSERDAVGNFYIYGNTSGIIEGSSPLVQHGFADVYLLKVSPGGKILWLKQLGITSAETNATKIRVDASGNVFVAGFTNGNFNYIQSGAHGHFDAYLAKINSEGELQWINQVGVADSFTFVNFFNIDSAGNSYLLGNTDAYHGGAQLGNRGAEDIYLTKIDAFGNRAWTSQIGSAGTFTDSIGFSVNASGESFIVGTARGNLGGTQHGTHGLYDLFLAKINSDGSFAASHQLGAAMQYTVPRFTEVDTSGNILVSGYTTGYLGGTYTGIHSASDIFVTKFDSSGDFLWVNQFGYGLSSSSSSITPVGMKLDASGNSYFYGNTHVNLPFEILDDAFLGKIDPLGNLLYATTLRAEDGTTKTISLAVGDDGACFLTGNTNGMFYGSTFLGVHGYSDAYVAKIDAVGAHVWKTQRGGGSGYTIATSIDRTSQGELISVGEATYSIEGESLVPGGPDAAGVYVQKLDAAGQLVWQRRVTHNDIMLHLNMSVLDSADSLFLLGNIRGDLGHLINGEDLNPLSLDGNVLLKIDASGNLQ